MLLEKYGLDKTYLLQASGDIDLPHAWIWGWGGGCGPPCKIKISLTILLSQI